jgi:GNAT superfamily N-acetyltransferase
MVTDIKIIQNEDEKSNVCYAILTALPEWFGNKAAIDEYVADVRGYHVIAAYDKSTPIAFCAVTSHNEHTAEISVMGVLKSYQRAGLGKHLIRQAEQYAISRGHKYLAVKTLDDTSTYEPYAKTRMFYRVVGFHSFMPIKGFWDAENPCLVMMKELNTVPNSEISEENIIEINETHPLRL